MILPLLLLVAQAAPATLPPGLLRADANRDGIITRAEAQASAEARFARIDKDADGTIAPPERRDFREAGKLRPLTAAQFQQRSQARFARLDRNRDGVLSGDERAAMPRAPHHGPRHGPRHGPGHGPHGPGGPRGDMKNGKPQPGMTITIAQFRTRALARFDRMDANRDGRVDAAEIAARRAARRS